MAAWENLCLDLAARILAHLPCLFHRALFGAVCSNWRAVAVQHPPPPQLPWVLLPSAARQAPGFFCILCKATHCAFLPDDVRTARCCGTHPGGSLILELLQQDFFAIPPQDRFGVPPQRDFVVYNLHTGVGLAVPDRLRTVDGDAGTGLVVLGAALSPAPTVDGACLAVALARCGSSIAFWIPGMPYLSAPMPAEPHGRASWDDMLPRGGIDDVIYFSGHGLEGFHVLTDAEEILVYAPHGFGPDGALAMRLVTYRFPGHKANADPGCIVSRYLLDYFGHLVMVVRFLSREHENTRRIHAYRLRMEAVQAGNHCERQAYWEEGWFCHHNVVMLGRCSSMAFPSPADDLHGLYFLDDAKAFDDVMAALQAMAERVPTLFPCADMGRCTVQHQQHLEPVFPIRLPSEFSHAVWFFH
jgi:hypothetical protein